MEDNINVFCNSCIHKEVCFAKDDYNKCLTKLENVACCDFFTVYCEHYMCDHSTLSNNDSTIAHC